jgi:ABC-type glycerol-3-phosphate transport system permease component
MQANLENTTPITPQRTSPGGTTGRHLRKYWWTYLLLGLFGFLLAMPLVWLLSSSLKTEGQIFTVPPEWIPSPVKWNNYSEVFRRIPFGRGWWNSTVVTSLATLGQVVSASLVAFGFARLRFPGRNLLFMVLIATVMIPYHVTLIPSYVLFRRLGWLDTFLPLIVPSWLGGSAFLIFLMRQFYMRLPFELDDAARVDGASIWQIFTHIVLPQSKPAVGVVAIFAFLAHWNDFFGPFIYLNSTDKYTLPLMLRLFQSVETTEWAMLMAASVMTAVPCVVLYFVAQRYFIQGVVFTGLKG